MKVNLPPEIREQFRQAGSQGGTKTAKLKGKDHYRAMQLASTVAKKRNKRIDQIIDHKNRFLGFDPTSD